MKRFEALTNYLPVLETINSEEMRRFVADVYSFLETHAEYNLYNYIDILKEHNIQWEASSMQSVDVSSLDERTVLALLVGVVRAERFCEGTIRSFIKSGHLSSWMTRLEETDKK